MARILEAGRNRASPDEAASFVEEYDRIEQQREVKLAEIDAEAKRKKRDLNKTIKADLDSILADAKKQGVKKGVIRALADPQKKRRKAQEAFEKANEKAEDALDALEEEDRDFAVDIRKALGDDFAGFGLGAAAVEREEGDKPDETTSAVVEAVKGSMSEEEWEKAGKKAKAAQQTEPAE